MLEDVGFQEILVKTHYLAEKVEKAIGKNKNVKLLYDADLIGTAQFLKKYQDKLDEEFIVMNGDTLTNLNLSEIIEFHLSNNNIATIFTKDNAIHSGGTYVFNKKVIEYLEDQENIPDLIQTLIDKDIPINLYQSNAWYLDIGSKKKLAKAKMFLQKKDFFLPVE